ncbi:hypothetical protein B0A49_05430 [Cryomyces minteri]|uniref:Transcription factor domain-containing protein n=1 Tax=Cryomyces minteri TaxID=331657 RepID=A0A4U0X3Q4_9PEZI|nr:hypothetical protein B0A49_05430 [Cryomyces minteri]
MRYGRRGVGDREASRRVASLLEEAEAEAGAGAGAGEQEQEQEQEQKQKQRQKVELPFFAQLGTRFPPPDATSLSGLAQSRPGTTNNAAQSVEDPFPPFATLTNDEDRERKAELQNPGTFHVIVVPDSFSDLPEYHEDPSASVVGFASSPDSRRPATYSFGIQALASEQRDGNLDPNVVILRRFEETGRRMSYPHGQLYTRVPAPLSSSGPPNFPSKSCAREPLSSYDSIRMARSFQEVIDSGGPDARLLTHYRDFLVMQVMHSSANNLLSGLEIFEKQAMNFSPVRTEGSLILNNPPAFNFGLYHAICALSALSLAYKGVSKMEDALQHYQQALPFPQSNINSPSDMCTDGVFFRHFFLLIYDVAAAPHYGISNMWGLHLHHLLRIVLIRRERPDGEPFPFLVWWISLIDIYACLSGSGRGELVNTLIQSHMFPAVHEQLPPLGPAGSPMYYPEEVELFAPILELNHGIVLLAAQLGRTAQYLRTEAVKELQGVSESRLSAPGELVNRQHQVLQMQGDLRNYWAVHYPRVLPVGLHAARGFLPERVQRVFEHAYLLYRTCLLFSHTSVWSGQRVEYSTAGDEEIEQLVSEVLELARTTVEAEHFERRFVVFPLFLAGFATSHPEKKRLAMELLVAMEPTSVGKNTAASRELLQTVYDLQRQSLMAVGHSLAVDWIDVMTEHGMHVVNFGL